MAISAQDKQEIQDAVRESVIDAMKDSCNCPYGMTHDDVHDVKEFMLWWKEVRRDVTKQFLKMFLWTALAISAFYAWITNH